MMCEDNHTATYYTRDIVQGVIIGVLLIGAGIMVARYGFGIPFFP